MTEDLYKIDIIRERLGVSYKEAQDALDQAGGDVVAAIVTLEGEEVNFTGNLEENKDKLVSQVQSILKQGNVTKVRVKKGGKVITEIPAVIGAIGIVAILISGPLAVLAGIGGIAGMMNDYTLEVIKDDGQVEEHEIEL